MHPTIIGAKAKPRASRRQFLHVAAATGLGALALPNIARAQNNPIRIGMPTILSGRVAMLGESSRNGALVAIERFNAAGGLNGRPAELVVRDSKGQPQEAARIARELINKDGCELIIDAEASSGAFAVHEVARDLGILVVHSVSETASLTADPKMRTPYAFRAARQGLHDSIVGAAYAAQLANANNLHRWMAISPDYSFGRDTTSEFFEYAQRFNKNIELVNAVWPKLYQADYSEPITRLIQGKPQAIFSCLWGGDLVSFLDQAKIYGLMQGRQFFGTSIADYSVLKAVKGLPPGLHAATRYLKGFPATATNAKWCDDYVAKFKTMPLNWSWSNFTAADFLLSALRKAKTTAPAKVAEALSGMTISSPFGVNGQLTMRGEDHTLVNYAIGWGLLSAAEPYMSKPEAGDWSRIYELEAEWKKSKSFA